MLGKAILILFSMRMAFLFFIENEFPLAKAGFICYKKE